MVHQLPQLGQVLDQGRYDVGRCADVGQGVGDDKGLQAGERVERDLGDQAAVQLLDVDTADMGERHGGGAEFRRVGDGEIDFVACRHTAFKGHAIGLGQGIAMTMLGEIEPFLLGQRGLEIACPADQAGLGLLAHAALEDGLDEDLPVAVYQRLDFVFRCARPENVGGGKIDIFQKLGSVKHSGNLHAAPGLPVPASASVQYFCRPARLTHDSPDRKQRKALPRQRAGKFMLHRSRAWLPLSAGSRDEAVVDDFVADRPGARCDSLWNVDARQVARVSRARLPARRMRLSRGRGHSPASLRHRTARCPCGHPAEWLRRKPANMG